MGEFNKESFKVKGVFSQDDKSEIFGYYYEDEHKRHFIISDEDFKHYETNPYTLCRNTGLDIKGLKYSPYEFDLFKYNEPMNGRERFGYLEFNQFIKGWVIITNSETNQYRTLDKCCNLRYTGRNVCINDNALKWFVEYSKKEYEKTKGNAIDNSYCPSKFRR